MIGDIERETRVNKASLLILSTLFATPAFGDAMPGVPPHDAFVPLPAGVTPICTDRPTKSNFACTVPDGQIQIEADGVNWSRLSQNGATTDTVLYTNPTVKLGVTPSTDIEANWVPYESVHTRGAAMQYGVGDLVLRLKQRLTAADAKVSISILPYVKAPTARHGIGNGQWEGGALLPVNIALPKDFTLTLVPEVDVLADSADPARRHAQYQQVVNLGKALTSAVTLYGELWTAQNFDPAGTVSQYSADFAVAWLVRPTLQFDLGGNFGLNKATPAAQLYVGVSTRF
jgi:hypothetical protein